MLEDQAYALDALVALCRDERADGLLVAGDVYDRAVPPEDAVRLFDDFLRRVAADLRIPVVVISGNHDSAGRLGFGAELLASRGVHLRTAFGARAVPVVVEGRGERALVYGLPYLEPDAVRIELGDDEIRGHEAATRAALVAAHAHRADAGEANTVLLAHLFAQGGRESVDSERPLVVGGAAQVSVSTLDGWSYVALGHLHEPQRVGGRDDIRYSGSLFKYSFGEAEHEKGVAIVELAGGRATVTPVRLPIRRDLVRIEGSFDELLRDPRFAAAEAAYVEATYTDRAYLIDVAARLRARFPHLLAAVPKHLTVSDEGGELGALEALRHDRDLLEGFWRHVVGDEPLAEAQVAAFERALFEARRGGEGANGAVMPGALGDQDAMAGGRAGEAMGGGGTGVAARHRRRSA